MDLIRKQDERLVRIIKSSMEIWDKRGKPYPDHLQSAVDQLGLANAPKNNCPECDGLTVVEVRTAHSEKTDEPCPTCSRAAYNAGHAANLARKTASSNPYRVTNIHLSRAWRNGWTDASQNSSMRGFDPTRTYPA